MKKIYKSILVVLTIFSLSQSKNVFAAVNQTTGNWLYDDEDTQICVESTSASCFDVYSSFEVGKTYYTSRLTTLSSLTDDTFGEFGEPNEYYFESDFSSRNDSSDAQYFVLDYTLSNKANFPVYAINGYDVINKNETYSFTISSETETSYSFSQTLSTNLGASISAEVEAEYFGVSTSISEELSYSIGSEISSTSTQTYTVGTERTWTYTNTSGQTLYAKYEIRSDCYAHKLYVFERYNGLYLTCLGCYYDYTLIEKSITRGLTYFYKNSDGLFKRYDEDDDADLESGTIYFD